MLCSARELGLGESQDGIMELAASLPLNQNLREALDLDDWVLEVNATPNRGDCMSVFGIARDYAAASARRHLKFETAPIGARQPAVFPVVLQSSGCPVFASRVIRGVKPNALSPVRLRERLRRHCVLSISLSQYPPNYSSNHISLHCHTPDP